MDDFELHLQEQLKKPSFKKAYDALEPEYALISQIIGARAKRGLSQAQLAKKMGTKQSAIARLESEGYNPSVNLLRKVAKATGTKLKILFEF
jgi:ribosome-binding protein aMBF1 (putative translation factor)